MANKVILIGNVGGDPTTRKLENNRQVSQLSIATSESYKRKDGTKESKTEWHNLVVWNGLSTVVESYVKKGDKIYVEGKLTHRSYENKEGVTVWITEIVCNDIKMLGSKPSGATSNAAPQQTSFDDKNNSSDPFAGEEDDLPF